MNVTAFKYSKSLWVFGIITPFLMVVACIAYINDDNWAEILPIITALVIVIVSFCKRCFTYDLKDKTALQLDDEKLVSYIDNKVVYWVDVIEIDYIKERFGIRILLKIARPDEDETTVVINTLHIEGSNLSIYEAIAEFASQAT